MQEEREKGGGDERMYILMKIQVLGFLIQVFTIFMYLQL
jgi:hypothetical protein